MTVSSTSSRVVYAGNGVTTIWPFAFKVPQAADLVVIYTDATGGDVTLSSGQYSATGFGTDLGGSVTYPLSGTPIASGTKLTIYRDVAATQPTAISNQGAMWPAVIEGALDRLTFIAQKVVDTVSRSVVASPTDSGTLNPLPNATQRANSFLAFDAAGQPMAALGIGLASVSSWLATNFLPSTSASAARTAIGAVGASANTAFSGNNTFSGTNAFTQSPTVPTGTLGAGGTSAASQAYADAAAAAVVSAGKNRLINGDFAIDQRNDGASQTFTAAAAIAYCVDRWYGSCTGANITGQRVAGTGVNQYAYRFTGASSNTGLLFGQRIESVNVADLVGQDVVVSLQVKSSSLTQLTWTAYYANSADTFSSKTQIATGTISGITGTLASKSFTFNAGANAANGIAIEFTGGALVGSQTLQLEAVQLESGTIVTTFERRLYGDRLAACRRYLPAFRATATGEYIAHGQAINATSAFLWYQFEVEPRTPTTGVIVSAVGHFACTTGDLTQKTCSVIATGSAGSRRGTLIDADSATNGLTAGQGSCLVAINSAAKLLFTGAEL